MGFRFTNLTAVYRTSRAASTSTRNHYLFNRHVIPSISTSLTENQNSSRTSRRWHGNHSHNHHHGGGKESDNIFKLGLAADIGLTVGKTLTGYLSGSTAIVADAAHSLSDVVLSGIALWSFKAAKAPKDEEHPYGHGKFETLGALGISCMLVATAGGIAWHALDVLHGVLVSTSDMINHSLVHNHETSHGHGGHHRGIDLDHPVLALSMMITSISVKEGLYWITKRAGEKEGSGLMKANAWHHRADAVSSMVALIGVGGVMIGVPFLDPLAGLVVSGMILKAGIRSGYESVMELVDAGVPFPTLAPIKGTILQVEGVKGCHRLRARKAGSSLYLDVHIEVDPFLSVSTAHDIGESVRHQIQKQHREVAEAFIHIDPSYSGFSDAILDRQKMAGSAGDNANNLRKQDHENIILNILSSKFPQKISVEHITRHLLQGRPFTQVQVAMPSDMLIRDAMYLARDAEKEILRADSSIHQVSIQLRLGEPIPQLTGGSGEST